MSLTIQGKEYEDIFALAKAITTNEIDFVKALRSEEVLSFVKREDENKGKRLDLLSLSSLPEDVFLFRAQEILNPFLPFSFHGVTFETYASLGTSLLSSSPTPDPTLLPILRYRLVSEKMKTSGYEKEHGEEYEKVLEIEKEDQEDIAYAYFSLGYYLSKSTSFFYRGVEYENLYNFTYYLIKKENDLNALGSFLSNSSLLEAYSNYSKDRIAIQEYLHLCKERDNSEEAFTSFQAKRKERLSKESSHS